MVAAEAARRRLRQRLQRNGDCGAAIAEAATSAAMAVAAAAVAVAVAVALARQYRRGGVGVRSGRYLNMSFFCVEYVLTY
jgi:hypothetical protein